MLKLEKRKLEIPLFELDEELFEEVKGICETKLVQAIQVQEKHAREDAITEVKTRSIRTIYRKRS